LKDDEEEEDIVKSREVLLLQSMRWSVVGVFEGRIASESVVRGDRRTKRALSRCNREGRCGRAGRAVSR
jgi:hypothetical protein